MERGILEHRQVHPMTWSYRALFVFCFGFGLVLLSIGVAGLLDLPIEDLREAETTMLEAVIALIGGAAFWIFAISGWRQAKAWLGAERLGFLRFGLVCRGDAVELDDIRRFGVGQEKHGYQSYHVLLLDLSRGGRRSIRISMYQDWRELVEKLGERLGREASATRTDVKGVRFLEG